jgi:hypothetical protein
MLAVHRLLTYLDRGCGISWDAALIYPNSLELDI